MQQGLLRIDTTTSVDHTIVSLKGELDVSSSASLIECFAAVVRDRPAHLDVDMSQLEYADSVGLSVFVTAHFQCRDAGVQLRFLNPNLLLQEILEVTGLADVLDVVTSTALCGA
jgi:anti-anti-sigma factor